MSKGSTISIWAAGISKRLEININLPSANYYSQWDSFRRGSIAVSSHYQSLFKINYIIKQIV